MIRSVLDMVLNLSSKCGLPKGRTCSALGIAPSSWHRWRHRTKTGVPLVGRPGPHKMESMNITAITGDITELGHGARRTEGVTSLYRKYSNTISRRELAELVGAVRRETNRDARARLQRLQWHGAGVAWAIDDTEYLKRDMECGKSIINHIEDLGAKYNLEPISGRYLPCGEEIAGHLAHLFYKYGAPLFLKRDGGGNLNHSAVNDVLAEYAVLPLNSPGYYPPYNGSIENAQGEIKKELDRQLATAEYRHAHLIEPYARVAANELNHKIKESLKGKTACHVFFNERVKFDKRKRKEIYDWIKSRQDYIICGEGESVSKETAWRVAAEQWLVRSGLVTVSINNRVLPSFSAKLSHNL
jgi:hypothetical protein